MTGHLVSAAAAVEAVICIAAIQRQAIAADDQPRQARPRLRPVPRRQPGRQRNGSASTLSNSFGFGGSNTSLVLKKVA